MVDVHESRVRSYNMSKIKDKNTIPEIIVRRFLHSKGLRYRLHNYQLPGKPDIVLKKYNTVIFINGCFWHMHADCKYFKIPKTRALWWKDKLEKNKLRDYCNYRELKKLDWNIMVIWECELKGSRKLQTLDITYQNIKNNN